MTGGVSSFSALGSRASRLELAFPLLRATGFFVDESAFLILAARTSCESVRMQAKTMMRMRIKLG